MKLDVAMKDDVLTEPAIRAIARKEIEAFCAALLQKGVDLLRPVSPELALAAHQSAVGKVTRRKKGRRIQLGRTMVSAMIPLQAKNAPLAKVTDAQAGLKGLGKALETWRTAHKMKRPDVAKKLGVSKWTLFMWERGKITPRPAAVRKIKKLIWSQE